MKTSIITKSALALALGLCASGAYALTTTNAFENFTYADGTAVTNLANSIGLTWSAGADALDYSVVSSGKLVVDTGDSSVTGALASASQTAFNNNFGNNAKFSAKVTFTPVAASATDPEIDTTNLKFALFAKDNGTSTNLFVVKSGSATAVDTTIDINGVSNAAEKTVDVVFTANNTFTVAIDGQTSSEYTFYSGTGVNLVEFSGNGEVDNIAFTYAATPYTMTWVADSASYVVDGVTNSLAGVSSPFTYYGEPGQTVKIIGTKGYMSGETTVVAGAGNTTALELNTYSTTFSDYFPRTATEGQNGSADHPYEIADEDDLIALKDWVARTNTCENLVFVQTASFALSAPWAGIGPNEAKDLVNGGKKNIPLYESEAFAGTYDGGNNTISNFQMTDGCDYGALFSAINNATIKNLKISWGASTLTPGSSGDTGATFVGVARGSTLQNLTTLAGTVTTVTAAKDIGGIVGYLMAGSTVDSCTNEINVASSGSSRKCGGIAIITQDGTGTATIRNCKNSGTVTATNKGGLVGYIGVATEIDGCENTANVQLFHFQSGSVSVSGVNKGHAGVASNDKSGGISGLYFATVDGDVATFVADDALATNNTYKVMSAGATATFAFAAPGTIAFNTALATPSYAITGASTLDVTNDAGSPVITYTAAWKTAETFAGNGEVTGDDPNIVVKSGETTASHTLTDTEATYLNTLVSNNGGTVVAKTAVEEAVAALTEQQFTDAVLLNEDVTKANAGSYTFKVTGLKKQAGNKVEVKVTLTRSGSVLGKINGTVVLKTSSTPNGTYNEVASEKIEAEFDTKAVDNASTQEFTATFTNVTDKFFKAEIKK